MNTSKYLLLILISLPVTSTQAYQHAHIVKKLQKAWRSNWVKAGALTSSCGTLYALYNIHQTNQKLFWGLTGLISALASGLCGYAYFNQDNKNITKNEDTSLILSDDFFAFVPEEDATIPVLLKQATQEPIDQITETTAMKNSDLPEAVAVESLDI